MADQLVGYFGYGSLVNRHTLHQGVIAAVPARLKGWRRHWQSRGDDMESGFALLSVHRQVECAIDGLLIIDKAANLPTIDRREARYDRVPLEPSDLVLHEPFENHVPGLSERQDLSFHVYVGSLPPRDPELPPRLIQSYLDVVLNGFLQEFGPSGVEHFFETTLGFDRAIHRDRETPVYSRAIKLEAARAIEFDDRLRRAGVIFD